MKVSLPDPSVESLKLKPEMIVSIERQLEYWRSRLVDAPILELPTDRPRPAAQSFSEESYPFSLPIDLTDRLKALSQREGVTLFMTLAAGFQILLHRYSGQDDILIGTPASGGKEGLSGFSGNTLVLRTDLSGNPSFSKLLAQVRDVSLGAYANQDLPFEKLLEVHHVQSDLSRNPLFQVMFIFRDDKSPINEMAPEFIKAGTTPFDLILELSETPHGLAGIVKYAADLFDAATIRRFIGHFQTLLEGIAAHPEGNLSELPLLTEAERQQLLIEWSAVQTEYPENKCIHQLFEEQVARTPDAIAVVFEDQQMSYRDLNQRANQLAHYLQAQDVQAQTMVAIGVERSLSMVIGLLGILKAGAAYVPLDPSYPPARLAYLLEDCQAKILLTQSHLEWPETSAHLINLDNLTKQLAGYSSDNPKSESSLVADNLAYVIYTSGSTGNPKGVMVSHANVSRLFAGTQPKYNFNSQDVWTLFHSYAFDFSVWELWGALFYGGKLVIVPYLVSRSPEEFYRLLVKEGVTVLNQTPSAFRQLIQVDQTIADKDSLKLRYVIFGGEALDFPSLSPWFKKHGDQTPQLINMYGITETTVHVTYHALTKADELSQKSIIGTALPDLQAYILDKNLQPQAIGIPGELYVAGAGLARGYLNRPELTAERFIPNPFSDKPNARLYKTGDLVRWLPDGNIEYLGRIDQQIQLRGFRIELGEIESALGQHPQLRDVVVNVYEPTPGDKRLVAYLVARSASKLTTSELRDFLKLKLPEYMTPSAFVFLDGLPLTPNGKLDRKALPEPDQNRQLLDADFIAPRSSVEKQLAEIWAEVLRIDRVGIHDNFFELGGQSLLATQVIIRVGEQLSMEIPLRMLFDLPTVAELAAHLESRQLAGEQMRSLAISRCARSELPPLSFAQMRMWLLECIAGPSGAYNIPFCLQIEGVLDNENALERAINEIVRRHETLRTYFAEQDGVPFQVIQPSLSITLMKLDLSNEPEELRETAMKRHIQIQAAAPFDLKKGPLLRAELIRLGNEKQVLMLTFHHIISDGWSMDVFTHELSTLYGAFSLGQPSPLPELPIQYVDYTVWQREQLQGETMDRLLHYWKTRLAGASTLELPTDRPRPAVQSFRGKTQQFSLSLDLTEGVKALSRREGVTLFMTLVAAFQVLLHRYSGQDDIVVGTPTAGRSRVELEGLIGFFVNTLVLRADLSNNVSFRELLAQVREVALGAYANQDMPFEKLVEVLNPQRDRSRNPLFQVMFVLQNTPDNKFQLNEITPEFLPVDNGTTHFDLTLELLETSQGLAGKVEYATDLFDAATIDRLIGHFQTLLEGIVAQPAVRLSELPLLTEPERRQLLVEWNDTAVPFSRDKCIHELFEAQVAATPQAVAVVYEDSRLTYAELNTQANRLAHYLIKLGVKPDMPVAISMDRSIDLVIGLLAILKAGGAYVPIDPTYPRERLAFMLDDTKAQVLLTHSSMVEELSVSSSRVVCLDKCQIDLNRENIDNPCCKMTSANLAYIIYTSGSTGVPKGVMIPHKALVNHMEWMQNVFPLTGDDKVLQKTPFGFDASVWEFFAPIISGAQLVLAAPGLHKDIPGLVRAMKQQAITVIQFVPSILEIVKDCPEVPECTNLKRVYCGGEALSSNLLQGFLAKLDVSLCNLYGPTEACIDTIYWRANKDFNHAIVPIGRPVYNTQIYILDRYLQPVPIGTAGEVHIGGDCLARGYLNRPELTAEKFIKHPFCDDVQARLYKTGDLARYLPDGTIEFLGRIDHQVKIRGLRIELGEIESVLGQHPQLREVVVNVYEPAPGDKRLVAYLVAYSAPLAPTPSELRDFLKLKLPEFMVPSVFVFLDQLPLTPNGKLDRKALPEPDQNRQVADINFIAPRSALEKQLAEIWSGVLRIDRIGNHDNFFELGGHSLLATQVIVRIGEQLSVEVPMTSLFEMPTVEELAKLIENTKARVSYPSKPITRQSRSAYKSDIF